jgi:2'-5' RNA ligase
LFVAVEMPSAIKDLAWSHASRLRDRVPGARWVPRDNYHVTVKFLGRVEDADVASVSAAAAQAASSMVAFEVRIGALGAFPSARRARVIWLGLSDAAGGFAAVASACEDAFEPLGFAAERRPFVPHLTLARLKVPAAVSFLSDDAVAGTGERFTVDRLTLFQSHLRRPAPVYEPLAVFPFGLGG